ncbi:MAG TPA: hypothetical protein PLR60_10300 [Syntrophorhabdaceae bacterium]|nr:hypothetical protein [Syntrophorhabdaceae bacterium]
MTKKRYALTIVVLIAVVAAGLVLCARTPLLIHFASGISRHLLGYELAADSFIFSPSMKAEIVGFAFSDIRRGNLLFTSSRVSVESRPGPAIRGEVEKIVLKDSKIRVRLGDKSKTESDLSFIKKIPPVRLLIMERGEFILHFKGSEGTITVKDINLSVKGFSPERGGELVFKGRVAIDRPGGSKISGTGACKGQINLTGIFPDMLGKGTIEVDMDAHAGDVALSGARLVMPVLFEKGRITVSGASFGLAAVQFTKDGQSAQVKNPQVNLSILYETASKRLAVSSLRIGMPGIGIMRGSARMTLQGAMPWSAALDAGEINFSGLFSMARSLLTSEEARKWSVQGVGSLKTQMEGTLSGKTPSLAGRANIEMKKGGFSSPDGTKAAQGINGSVILNFSLPRGEKDGSINISSVISSGEYLWGRFYKDMTKEASKFSSKADMTISERSGPRLKGTCDLFNTGRYSYSGSFDTGQWGFHVTAQDVPLKRVVSLFLSDYLAQTSAALKGIEADGKLDTELSVASVQKGYAALGNIKLEKTSLKLPGVSLGITGIDVNLPFDLVPAGTNTAVRENPPLGMIEIAGLTKGDYSLEGLKVPVVAFGSDVTATGIISIPFYDGTIRIRNLKVNDALGTSPKISFASSVSGVNVPRLLNELTGLSFPGSVKARFPDISYQDGQLTTQGRVVIDIFGGKIEAAGFYVKNLFAPSRRIGGSILFQDIDLGKVTETIKVGKITGLVEGFVKDLEIEYGQPSRFVFEMDTAKKGGGSRKVSVDAIENISILGTGTGGIGAVLKSGINKFFKEYPYSRIGIRCTLENDIFNIRGKIREGGKEYLIRRAFLRGIDVVNMDPQNMVSFKDMQERIGRVFQKGKDGEGPTIKMN